MNGKFRVNLNSHLETPTPATTASERGHLLVFLVELLQIRGLGGGDLRLDVVGGGRGNAPRLALPEVLADVPAVDFADPRANVFKVGQRTCGQSLQKMK